MQSMDLRLFHAARLGDIQELHAILKDDPTALYWLNLSPIADTPLHVATLTEKVDFIKEMTRLRPCLAWEANKDGLIPLHMACAAGNTSMVSDFLGLGKELCFVKDKGGRTCLHYAALKGRVVVIRELLFRCPQAAKEVTVQGDTALHLAVKHGHFHALKALVEGLGEDANDLVHAKDGAGQTVAHLAAATKQVQVEMLLSKSNKEGSGTILDEERSTSYESTQRSQLIEERPEEAFFRNLTIGLERMVHVVAGLITSVTFVVALSPPTSIWKENMKIDWKCIKRIGFPKSTSFENMSHPTVHCPEFLFVTFASFNTAGFISAVLIIVMHPNSRIRPLLLFSALIFLTLTYLTLTISISPNILTFLATYGATILSFLAVILYVVMLNCVLRHFLHGFIMTIRKLRQRSEARPGLPKWKASHLLLNHILETLPKLSCLISN